MFEHNKIDSFKNQRIIMTLIVHSNGTAAAAAASPSTALPKAVGPAAAKTPTIHRVVPKTFNELTDCHFCYRKAPTMDTRVYTVCCGKFVHWGCFKEPCPFECKASERKGDAKLDKKVVDCANRAIFKSNLDALTEALSDVVEHREPLAHFIKTFVKAGIPGNEGFMRSFVIGNDVLECPPIGLKKVKLLDLALKSFGVAKSNMVPALTEFKKSLAEYKELSDPYERKLDSAVRFLVKRALHRFFIAFEEFRKFEPSESLADFLVKNDSPHFRACLQSTVNRSESRKGQKIFARHHQHLETVKKFLEAKNASS